jgi:hypothetical protein
MHHYDAGSGPQRSLSEHSFASPLSCLEIFKTIPEGQEEFMTPLRSNAVLPGAYVVEWTYLIA